MDMYRKSVLFWIFVLGNENFHNGFTAAGDIASDQVNSKLSLVEELSSDKDQVEAHAESVHIHSKVDVEAHHLKEQSANSVEADDLPVNGGKLSESSNLIDDNATLSGNQSNSSQVTDSNEGDSSKSNSTTKSGRPTKVTCLQKNDTENLQLTVQVLNSSLLPSSFQTVPNATAAQCVLVLFYAPWCYFSAAAAPHYNALPRLFPDISCVAINSAAYSSLNARYGTVALPTLLLFHNGQPVAKFNESQYTLDNFAAFVTKYTSLHPTGAVNVTSADFEGPLPSAPSEDSDYLLWIAWIFFVSCCCYGFMKSSLCHRIVEILRNNWQEAEAQHEHAE